MASEGTGQAAGDWSDEKFRNLLARAVAHAAAGIEGSIRARNGTHGLEEDLRGPLVRYLRAHGELVLTEARCQVPGWSQNLGGFDIAVIDARGNLVLAETKWADGNLYEAMWDVLKIASATTMPRVRTAAAICGAPAAHWHKGVPGTELFREQEIDVRRLLDDRRREWAKNIAGSSAFPTTLPAEVRTRPVAASPICVLERDWEVRAIEVSGGEAQISISDP